MRPAVPDIPILSIICMFDVVRFETRKFQSLFITQLTFSLSQIVDYSASESAHSIADCTTIVQSWAIVTVPYRKTGSVRFE